ncbi:hypothetical protein DFJ58DRAFT_726529 [Suillus subalutaceus]|uniref:uncharacterized protein n=1 Tax=Suillus subalutaceus TaxID=48586 RepID=UPI001B87550E|nr:uncharacterized protein DFJ58DRAFT_726529 [Suillus subalutaceus]KAG1858745.1 hypothetical protein DFJ58DRAFT_726529 [Suillus subalutaceus]
MSLARLKGATAYLVDSQGISTEAAAEDQDEEVESLLNSFDVDNQAACGTLRISTNEADTLPSKHKRMATTVPAHHDQLSASLETASAGVIVDTTLSDYQRCNENDIWTGKAKPPNVPHATYGTAQKMRAANIQQSLESTSETHHSQSRSHNTWLVFVEERYGLERLLRARAMDEATMKHLWDFLWATPRKEYGPTSRKRKAENPAEWAGFVIRSMLLLLYLVSMICLLRYDEALWITWADITFQVKDNSVKGNWLDASTELLLQGEGFRPADFHVRLELPFRKTHQYGGIAPFYVYADEQRPWMCLVRTFAVWWMLARERCENLDGFIFWKKIGTDSISVNPTDGMTSDAFLECFCNNLLDIGVDPRPYGTHSFRRGRCQFLYKVCRWDFGDICDWGGWAENFDNPGTIFKYLLSWNDNPREKREHYMNPNRPRKTLAMLVVEPVIVLETVLHTLHSNHTF